MKDVLRLSESQGLLNNIQIASTSSIASGSQVQSSIFINYVPSAANVAIGRPDLGGNVQVEFDRWTAFYHS